MLGFEGGLSTAGSVRVSSYDVGASFFPWEKFFYVRGATGLTTLGTAAGTTKQGMNVLVGLGVAIGRPRGLTVTVNLESQYHVMASRTPASLDRDVSSYDAWLGLDWY